MDVDGNTVCCFTDDRYAKFSQVEITANVQSITQIPYQFTKTEMIKCEMRNFNELR